jgi:glycerol-3-phosphate acyltransferase PlsX
MAENRIRIVIDAMGGDNSPWALVEGAVLATKEHEDVFLYIVGPKNQIETELAKYEYSKDQIEVVDAPDVISCHDQPVEAVKKKKSSSLVVGLNLVREGKAEALISAGSTGAVLVGGRMIVGRIKGIRRSPLAPLIPRKDGVSLLIDCGANMDSRPNDLLQFAQMGSIYMKHIVGVENPRVAIVNVGAEEEKGNALVKETFPLLKECKSINFIGSIEARDIPFGYADVIVCDAFVGNVILKLYEGTASFLVKEITSAMTSSPISTVGAALAKPKLKAAVKSFDASNYGGAPLLGINGLVAKVHGSSKASEVKNAVTQCMEFSRQHIKELIQENISAGASEE